MRNKIIYFHEELVAKVIETIKDATELADVRSDLQKIINAQNRIQQFGDTVTARKLNSELRKKYPIIDEMLAFANTVCPPVQQDPMSRIKQKQLWRQVRFNRIAVEFSVMLP